MLLTLKNIVVIYVRTRSTAVASGRGRAETACAVKTPDARSDVTPDGSKVGAARTDVKAKDKN
jgi:hypothetical protein